MPTSPVDHYLTGMSLPLTDENREIVTRSMGLDQPLLKQYTTWITGFLKGDWGKSLTSRLDIRTEFMAKMPYSFGIGLGGILLGAFFAYFLGFGAALHRNGFCDRFSSALSVFTQAVPGFIVAILIIYFFGVKLKAVKFFTGDGKFSVYSSDLIEMRRKKIPILFCNAGSPFRRSFHPLIEKAPYLPGPMPDV